MNETDHDALTRATAACRAESAARAKQIDGMLADQSWERVARFASFSAQKPWLDTVAVAAMPCPSLRSGQTV